MTVTLTSAQLEALTDSDALSLISDVASARGFATLVMTRSDAATIWQTTEDDPDYSVEPTLTDEQWDAVTDAWAWNRGFKEEPLMTAAWDLVRDAVDDARKALTATT